MAARNAKLTRKLQAMSAEVKAALSKRRLTKAYDARPDYQRNDYLAWIKRAKKPETREKRLAQMLAELKSGDSYMNMAWKPRA